jgi:hypothetical protein
MKTRISILAVSLIMTMALSAAETRRHYYVATKNMAPAFEVTRIHDDKTIATTRTFLIADTHGPLLRVDVLHDYAGRKTVTSYRLMRSSRASATISIDLPFASATREGRQAEVKAHPEILNAAVPVRIEGPAGAVRDLDETWHRGGVADAARGRARQALGPELMSTLANVKELAGLPMFADLNASLGYFFEERSLVHRSSTLLVAIDKANCAFDLRFNAPCTP